MTTGNRSRLLVLIASLLVLAAACGGDEPAEGSVMIETDPDFDARPVVGTFEVTEGASILGCTSGTFQDTFDEATQDVSKLMECSDGGTGTFTIMFDPDGYETGPGENNGPWSITDATGDFDGVEGGGDFWLLDDVETFSGDITSG